MKVFECQNCKYKVKINKIPDDYKCPECGIDKEYFVEEEKRRKPLFLLFLYSITLLMLIISGSFTISTIYNQSKIPHHNVQVGKISLELVEQGDTTIRLYNAYPMSDEKAITLDPFLFNINNNGTYALNYTLKLVDVPDNELYGINEIIGKRRINNTKVKFSLTNTKTNTIVKQGFISDLKNETILRGKINAQKNNSYALRLWIDKNVGNEDQNKFYVGRIVLNVYEIYDCDDDDDHDWHWDRDDDDDCDWNHDDDDD